MTLRACLGQQRQAHREAGAPPLGFYGATAPPCCSTSIANEYERLLSVPSTRLTREQAPDTVTVGAGQSPEPRQPRTLALPVAQGPSA